MSLRVGAYIPGMQDQDLTEGGISHWFNDICARTTEPVVHLKSWPDRTHFIAATGNDTKRDDAGIVISSYMDMVYPDALIQDTNPESDEGFSTPYEIVYHKGRDGIIHTYNNLALDVRQERLEKAGIESDKRVIVWTNDVTFLLDPRIGQHPVWNDIKQNSRDHLVQQAFTYPQGFPGLRMKELTLVLGEAEVLRRIKLASQDLGIEDISTVVTTMWFGPLVPDSDLPLPENGIIVQATELNARRYQEHDYSSFYVGKYDQVDIVLKYGKTVEELRTEQSAYITHESPTALGLRDFISAYKIPEQGDQKLAHSFSGPVKLVSNLKLSAVPAILGADARIIAGYERSGYGGDLSDLTKVERSVYHGHGTVIENPLENIPYSGHISHEDMVLLRKIEALLFFSHIFSLNQFDAFHGSGRPLAVEEKFYNAFFKPWLKKFFALNMVADPKRHVIVYKDEEDLRNKIALRGYDLRKFKYNNYDDRAAYALLDENRLKAAFGLQPKDNFGFVIGLYGSASTKNHLAIDDAYCFAMSLASDNDGLAFSSGGGTEGVMGAAMSALINAREAGWNNFRKFATRARIVSNREGTESEFHRRFNIEPGDPNFFVREVQHLAPRQHDVMSICSVDAMLPGGSGTIDENATRLLHNLRVHLFGEGLFKGHSNNTNSIPSLFINTPMKEHDYGTGYFNPFVELFTKAERDKLNMHVFSGPNRILEARAACEHYRKEFEKTKPAPKTKFRDQGRDAPQFSFS